jgi:RNA polymerase sigma-70 factor (ECF subfamily)
MPIYVAANLVEAACSGGPVEVEQLIEAAWPDAYRLALAVLGDASSAEDAAQEACIRLYRSISSLRSASAFRVWFYRIIVREASAQKRRQSRLVEAGSSSESCAPEEPAILLDVWHALDMLPQKLREVVVLHYYEDLSSREIASVLGIPDGTVRFRLMTARRHLRDQLGEKSVTSSIMSGEVTTHAI